MTELATNPAAAPDSAYGRTLLGRLDRRLLQGPAARWLLLGLFTAAFLAACPKFVRNIHTVEVSAYRGEKLKTALGRWLADARALRAGEDPYGPGHWFPNPPLVLLGLVPLSALPLTAAAAVWLAAKYAAVLAAVACLVAAIRRPQMGVPLGVLLVAGLFSIRPILGDVQHGNINIFVLLEIAAAWLLFVRRQDLSAGVVLALAVATKVTPALLLIYFAYKRAWRVLAGAALGLVLFVVVIPGAILGFGRSAALHSAWFDLMVRPYALEGWVSAEISNQSLPGTLVKWQALPEVVGLRWPGRTLGAAGEFLEDRLPVQLSASDEVGGSSAFFDVFQLARNQVRVLICSIEELRHADLGRAWAADLVALRTGMPLMGRPDSRLGALVLRAAGLGLIVVLAWLCRTRTGDRRDPRLLLELSLVLLAMLLLSERTWKHHLVTLLVVYLAAWQVLACTPWSSRFRAVFVAGLAAQLLLLQARADVLLYAGLITLGLLLAFLQNGWLLRRLGPAPVEVRA
jgi:hypothetical protein